MQSVLHNRIQLLDIAQERFTLLQWRPMLISDVKCGTSTHRVHLLTMVRDTQQNTKHYMPLLVVHYGVAKVFPPHSRSQCTLVAFTGTTDFWHVYKNFVNIMYRQFLLLFTHVLHPHVEAGMEMQSHSRFAVPETTAAAVAEPPYPISPLFVRKFALLCDRDELHSAYTEVYYTETEVLLCIHTYYTVIVT